MYNIKRECYNEKTFNGYKDNPYWLITLDSGYRIGLRDDGTYWDITDQKVSEVSKNKLKTIIKECKLNIELHGS